MMKRLLDFILPYKSKYEALAAAKDEASKNALNVLQKYEAICASLPSGHELSTQFYWGDYADRKLLNENRDLRDKVKKLIMVNDRMLIEWREAMMKFGVEGPNSEESRDADF